MANNKTKILFIEHAQGFGGSVVSLSESLKGMKNTETFVLVLQDSSIIDKLYSPKGLVKKRLHFNYLLKTKYTDFLNGIFKSAFLVKIFLLPFVIIEKIESALLLRFIVRLVKKNDIKLIYSNNGFNPLTVAAAKRCLLPCTLHFRGYKQTPYPFEKEEHHYPSLFFAISHFVANYLIQSGVPKEHVFTIHNSVDTYRFEQAYLRRDILRNELLGDSDIIAIGVFGRITEWKGQKDLTDAVKVLQHQTNIRFKVFIVGDCSDEDTSYYEQLRVSTKALVADGKLVFCGYQRDFENYYTAMDIVVHTSNVAEPFGRVIIEGMAAKTAVIGMNEGGPAEVITDAVDGLLVEPRSQTALVEALVRLCENKDLRDTLSSNAFKTVKEKYTPEYVGGEIERQLFSVIDNFKY